MIQTVAQDLLGNANALFELEACHLDKRGQTDM